MIWYENIERFHSRDNAAAFCMLHHFFVLEHQHGCRDVMWKCSISIQDKQVMPYEYSLYKEYLSNKRVLAAVKRISYTYIGDQ